MPPEQRLGDASDQADRFLTLHSRPPEDPIIDSPPLIAGLRACAKPAREHEAVCPVLIVQVVTPDARVPLARVDHHPCAFIDTDMRDERLAGIRGEEQQITPLKLPPD